MSVYVEETALTFKEWCGEQDINPVELLKELWKVCYQWHPKRNTIHLQGASNAGKTYWLHSMIPEKSVIGEMITSQDFAFQECTNKRLILINELTLSTPEHAELHKQILEGQPVMVNVKNKPASLMERKPVLCSSNQPIWTHLSNERTTFMNRCYPHLGLRPSLVLKEASGRANPKFIQGAFEIIQDMFEMLSPMTETDDNITTEEETCDEFLDKYIKDLANNYEYTADYSKQFEEKIQGMTIKELREESKRHIPETLPADPDETAHDIRMLSMINETLEEKQKILEKKKADLQKKKTNRQ